MVLATAPTGFLAERPPIELGKILINRQGPTGGQPMISTATLFVPPGYNGVAIEAIPEGGAPNASMTVVDSISDGSGFSAVVDQNGTASGMIGPIKRNIGGVRPFVKVQLAVTAGVWTITAALIAQPSVSTTNVPGNVNVSQIGGSAVGAGNPLPVVQEGPVSTTENLAQVGGAAVSLGQKTMANSLPVAVASDQVVTQQPIHPAATTGTFTTTSTPGTSVVGPVSMQNLGSAIVTVHGTYGAGLQLAFEADDGSGTWYPVQAVRSNAFVAETTSAVLAANQLQAWELDLGGFTNFRVRDLANPASGTATVTIIPTAESADPAVAVGGSFTAQITGNSPAAAGTAQIGAAVLNLAQYRSLHIEAVIQGATGGTLDLYLQASYDNGTTWVDYAHFTQLAAAAAQITRLITVSRQGNSGAAPVAVGSGNTPALAANTVVGGDFGQALRLLAVAGAGTTAGAAQTINIFGDS